MVLLQASICAGTLALMDAGATKAPVGIVRVLLVMAKTIQS